MRDPRDALMPLKAQALDLLPHGVAVVDGAWRVRYANAAFETLCGYAQETLRDEDAPLFFQAAFDAFGALREAADRDGTATRQMQVQHRDGTPCWAEVSLQPMAVREDEAPRWLLLVHDLSAQRQATEALRHKEAAYRVLVEHAPVLISRHDLAGRYLYASPFARRLLGYAPETLLGRKAYDLIHPDDRQLVATSHAGILEGGEAQTTQYRLRRQDDRYVWVETLAHVLYDAVGRPQEIIAYSYDVTQRRRAEEALRDGEARWRHLVAETPMPVLLHRAGEIIYANEAAARLVGLDDPRRFDGQQLARFVYADDLPRMQQRLQALMAGQEVPPVVFRVRSLEGAVRHVEVHSAVVVLRDGPAVQVVLRDVTAQQHEQAALRQAIARAETQAAHHSRAFADLGHELRTPLTSILGYAATLAEEEQDPGQREMADIIFHSGQRLLAILNSVVDLSTEEQAAARREGHPVDLNVHVRGVVGLMRVQAEAKGLTLTATLPEHPVWAKVDGVLFERALLNQLSNAVKYTREGVIEVHVTDDAGAVKVAVQDTGVGIDAAFLPRLFDAFERAPETAGQAEGAGLGLAITRRLVEIMNGHLHVESTPGQGSSFTMTFAQASDASAPPAPPATPPVDAS